MNVLQKLGDKQKNKEKVRAQSDISILDSNINKKLNQIQSE